MLKAIFFDLDDTLLWDEQSIKKAFQETAKVAEEKYGIDPVYLEKSVREEARKIYATYPTYEFTKRIGINPFEGLWGDFLDQGEGFQKLSEIVPSYRKEAWSKGLIKLGVNDPSFGEYLSERFRKERKAHPYVYEDTFPVLNQLREKYKLLLLTNGSPSLQKTKLQLTPTLPTYFDHIVISGDFGKGKPSPELFQYALKLLQMNKNEVIMVGDNLMTDILGAANLGMKSVWLNRKNKNDSDISPTFKISNLYELVDLLNN